MQSQNISTVKFKNALVKKWDAIIDAKNNKEPEVQ